MGPVNANVDASAVYAGRAGRSEQDITAMVKTENEIVKNLSSSQVLKDAFLNVNLEYGNQSGAGYMLRNRSMRREDCKDLYKNLEGFFQRVAKENNIHIYVKCSETEGLALCTYRKGPGLGSVSLNK